MERFLRFSTKKKKFISSVLAGVFYLFGGASLVTLGTLNVFLISHIYHGGQKVTLSDGNLIIPIVTFCFSAFSPLAGIFEALMGPKVTLIVCSTIIELLLIGLYFQRNLGVFYFLIVLIGVAYGSSLGINLKNACNYYTKKKGLIGGAITSSTVFGTAAFTLIGQNVIINPKNIPADESGFYPEEVSNKVKNYVILCLITIPISLILAIFFFIKYDKNFEEEQRNSLASSNKEEEKEVDAKTAIKATLIVMKTKRFWFNVIMLGVAPFYHYFTIASFRTYITSMKSLEKYSSIFMALSFVSVAFFAPIWAFLVDKFGFQIIIKILCGASSLIYVYFGIFLQIDIMYLIGVILVCLFQAGFISTMNPHVMQVYGFRYFLIIGGMIKFFNGVTNIIASVISVVLSNGKNVATQYQNAYKYCALGSIPLAVIGFIISFCEDDKKFIFGEGLDEEVKEEVEEMKKDRMLDYSKTLEEDSIVENKEEDKNNL